MYLLELFWAMTSALVQRLLTDDIRGMHPLGFCDRRASSFRAGHPVAPLWKLARVCAA